MKSVASKFPAAFVEYGVGLNCCESERAEHGENASKAWALRAGFRRMPRHPPYTGT